MRWIAPLLLVAGSLALLLCWNELPESWPLHWGPSGQVNGWGHRELPQALLPFATGGVLWLLLEGVAVLIGRRGAAFPLLTAGTVAMVRWVNLSLAITAVFVGVVLPLLRPDPALALRTILGVVFLGIGLGFAFMLRAGRKSRAAAEELPPGYRLLGYHDPDDPRLLVPKIHGLGYTFNFARPMAWVLVAGLLLPALLAILLVLLQLR